MRFIKLFFIGLILLLSAGQAGAVVWDYEYTAVDLPENSGYTIFADTGTNLKEIVEPDILHIDSSNATANLLEYRKSDTNFNQSAGLRIDFRLKIENNSNASNYFRLAVYTGVTTTNFDVYNASIGVTGTGGNKTYSMNTHSYTVYSYRQTNNVTEVYVDDVLRLDTNSSGSASSNNRLEFGDFSGGTYHSNVSLDYLNINGTDSGATPPSSSHTNPMYVATWGSDSNNGTFEYPFANISVAAATAQANDTIYVFAGTYYNNDTTHKVLFSATANATHQILLTDYNGTVIMDGNHSPYYGVGATDYGMKISGQYITIRNITIQNYNNSYGVWISGTNNTLDNVSILHTGSFNETGTSCGADTARGTGLVIANSHNTLTNSTLWDSGCNLFVLSGTVVGETIHDTVITNTSFNHSWAHGIVDLFNNQANESTYIDGLTFRNNTVNGNIYPHGSLPTHMDNITIADNTFNGLDYWDSAIDAEYFRNSIIENNTISNYKNLMNYIIGAGGTRTQGNVTFKNNTVLGGTLNYFRVNSSTSIYLIENNWTATNLGIYYGSATITDHIPTSYNTYVSDLAQTKIEYTNNRIFTATTAAPAEEYNITEILYYPSNSSVTINSLTNDGDSQSFLISSTGHICKPTSNYIGCTNTSDRLTIDAKSLDVFPVNFTFGTDILDMNITVDNVTSGHNYSLKYYPNATVIETVTAASPIYFNQSLIEGDYYITDDTDELLEAITDGYYYSYDNGTSWNYTTNTSVFLEGFSAHAWVYLSVMAHNTSFNTNSTAENASVQIPDNPIVITNITEGYNYEFTEGETFTADADYTDADGDIGLFSDNSSEWDIDVNTGAISWVTSGVGVHAYQVTATNSTYSSSSSVNFTVTVYAVPTFIPSSPVSLSNTSGNFWVNYTWSAGSGNITDFYNVSQNDTWSNGTADTNMNTTLSPHGWSNITVYSYNSSGAGTLNETGVSMNTQLSNNDPVMFTIPDYTDYMGDVFNISFNATDPDDDILTYETNATKGTYNTTTGLFEWTVSEGDIGEYIWYFRATDGYGGIDTEIINVTILESDYIPDTPISCISAVGTDWMNASCSSTGTNITDGMNISLNGNWKNTSVFWINETGLSEGTLYEARFYSWNNSGNGSLNLTYASISNTTSTTPITEFEPLTPINCSSTNTTDSINVSCERDGSGNLTDEFRFYNVTSGWHNTTDLFWNETGLGEGIERTYRIYAYNTSGSGTLNTTYASETNTTSTTPASPDVELITSVTPATNSHYPKGTSVNYSLTTLYPVTYNWSESGVSVSNDPYYIRTYTTIGSKLMRVEVTDGINSSSYDWQILITRNMATSANTTQNLDRTWFQQLIAAIRGT